MREAWSPYQPPDGQASDRFMLALRDLDGLLADLDDLPYPAVQEKVHGLVHDLDTLHRTGLQRLVTLLSEDGPPGLLERLAEDEVVRALLCLYNLLPRDELTVVGDALAEVNVYLASHDGSLEVVGVTDGMVELRLSGACAGCDKARAMLYGRVETALREGYPAFKGFRISEDESGEGK